MANRSAGLISGLTSMVHRVKSSITKKFHAFYLKRVHDTELAPTKTFNYDFDISSGGTAHRRSLAKLKGLIIKYIMKSNPVVALAAKEFMPIENSNAGISVNLFEIELSAKMPEVDAKVFKRKLQENRLDDKDISAVTLYMCQSYDRMARSVIQSEVQFLKIQRYLKYLEYLARKHSIPIRLRMDHNSVENGITSTYMRYQISVQADFVGWVPATNRDEQRYAEILAGAQDDSFFSAPGAWSVTDVVYLPANSKFHVAKFFLHLDKAVKVMNTLTRKIEYGYNAFSFRTA